MKRGELKRKTPLKSNSKLMSFSTLKAKVRSMKKMSPRSISVITKDEETYEEVWNSRSYHSCEECGRFLGDSFRDQNGRVMSRYIYSHIMSKGAHPEFRNDMRNFNLLCMEHHQQWESGDRRSMGIYNKNQVIISTLMQEYNGKAGK